MKDKELIDECVKAHGCKNLKAFCNLMGFEYPTIASWHSNNEIPSSRGYNRQYLQALIRIKELEKEIQLYENIEKAKQELSDFKKAKK